MPKKEKILVAMSGGVDSSVAAALLVKKGYDVTGMFAVNYEDPHHPQPLLHKEGSCWLPDYQDALRVCAKLGIKLLRLNFVKEYKKLVLNYMYREYEAGRTPNPDVLCNKFIKFGVWLVKAKELGFNKIATGHYANVAHNTYHVTTHGPGAMCYVLRVAKDANKDQTYFLHQLTQSQLKHVLFPIGNYTKPQVRALAKKLKLPTAEKEESMGICFVGEVPMKEFLQKKIKPHPGKIIMSDGQEVGRHEGLAFYTIGERGLGINKNNKPLYVLDKNKKTNELIVGFEEDPLLYKKEIEVENLNWISGAPKFPFRCLVRLRHRQPLQKCTVCHCEEAKSRRSNLVQVKFNKSQRAVTPGQFAVFYLKGKCLGGGVIV